MKQKKTSSCCSQPPVGRGLCGKHYKEQYRKENRDKILAQEKARRAINVASIRRSLRNYKYSLRGRWKYMNLDAVRRNLSCTISLEQYGALIDKPCYYCEQPLPASCCTGLDRIDNSRGYEPDNVLPSCGTCNVLRRNKFTVGEAKAAVMAIQAYRKAAAA